MNELVAVNYLNKSCVQKKIGFDLDMYQLFHLPIQIELIYMMPFYDGMLEQNHIHPYQSLVYHIV